jgi:cation-transporting ATPase I
VVSQFFGCTPIGPFAWLTVAGCATGTTVLAAVTGRLLPAAGQHRRSAAVTAPTVVPAEPTRRLPVGDHRPTPELQITETR